MARGKNGTSIRLATPDDADVMTRLRWKMYLATGRDEDTADRNIYGINFAAWLRKKLASGEYTGWLAVAEDGEVVGMVGLWVREAQPTQATPDGLQGYVINVFVDERYRSKGLARRMMDLLMAECRRKGLKLVSLHASVHGRPLYESMGFKPTNEMRIEL